LDVGKRFKVEVNDRLQGFGGGGVTKCVGQGIGPGGVGGL
jgi:hypothetical protein